MEKQVLICQPTLPLFSVPWFHQQNCSELCFSTELSLALNFYSIFSSPYTKKIKLNLLEPKLLLLSSTSSAFVEELSWPFDNQGKLFKYRTQWRNDAMTQFGFSPLPSETNHTWKTYQTPRKTFQRDRECGRPPRARYQHEGNRKGDVRLMLILHRY